NASDLSPRYSDVLIVVVQVGFSAIGGALDATGAEVPSPSVVERNASMNARLEPMFARYLFNALDVHRAELRHWNYLLPHWQYRCRRTTYRRRSLAYRSTGKELRSHHHCQRPGKESAVRRSMRRDQTVLCRLPVRP